MTPLCEDIECNVCDPKKIDILNRLQNSIAKLSRSQWVLLQTVLKQIED